MDADDAGAERLLRKGMRERALRVWLGRALWPPRWALDDLPVYKSGVLWRTANDEVFAERLRALGLVAQADAFERAIARRALEEM